VIVLDTSVLIDFFRGRRTVQTERLRQLELEEVPFSIPAVCGQEVLAGARDEEEWQLLLEYLETQEILWPGDPWLTHREAARIWFECRRAGMTVRSSVDCFIAQLVLEAGGILLHADKDFELIKRLRPLRTLTSG
jgi:predicted nucleic acid-binding protein